jgi:hypothetical protein
MAFVCNRAPDADGDAASVWESGEVRSFWAIQRSPLAEPAVSGQSRPSFVFRLDRVGAHT